MNHMEKKLIYCSWKYLVFITEIHILVRHLHNEIDCQITVDQTWDKNTFFPCRGIPIIQMKPPLYRWNHHLYNGNSQTGKTVSSYWMGPSASDSEFPTVFRLFSNKFNNTNHCPFNMGVIYTSIDSTHWGWDKVTTVFQTACSDLFCMKITLFLFIFHWNLFLCHCWFWWRLLGTKPLSEPMMV